LFADWDFGEVLANFTVEAVSIHAAVLRGIAQANDAVFHLLSFRAVGWFARIIEFEMCPR